MEIFWLGDSSFLIKDSLGRRLLIDPPKSIPPTKFSSILPKIITFSHPYIVSDLIKTFAKESIVINEANYYEGDFATVTGYPSYQDNMSGIKRGPNIIYTYKIDNFTLCHLGMLGHFPNLELINSLNNIDILFIPIGGNIVLDGKLASKLVKMIRPKIVIPMAYKTLIGPNYLDDAKKFLSSLSYNIVLCKDSLYLDNIQSNTVYMINQNSNYLSS